MDSTNGSSQLSPGEPDSVKLPDHERNSHLIAQQIGYYTFVIALVTLGAVLGYQLGAWIVHAGGESTISWLSPLRDVVHTTFGADANIVGFAAIGGLLAFLLATAAFKRVIGIGEALRISTPNEKAAIFIGVVLGLIVTIMVTQITYKFPPSVAIPLTILLLVAFVYLGVVGMLSMKDDFRFLSPSKESQAAAEAERKLDRIKILDTNVIIDGRVIDVCRTGFIEGPIYIPGFVLDEIQHIADSADSLKRARGRRGLDILNQMRSELPLIVRTLDARIVPAPNEEVDSKLVKLAKQLDGAIVTNDFNLNKVAELQGVPVLNINELANALKPVVLPGEEMRVTVIKEGKEMNQGVAYLDDGTMIVIEGGRKKIGETLDVVVSSVLQTVAGKMIFAAIKLPEEHYNGGTSTNANDDDGTYDPNPRPYPGGRTRRPLR